MTPPLSHGHVIRQRPDAVGVSSAQVTVTVSETEWLTPGAHIARSVACRPEVRLVLERLEPERYSVFVVLDKDPEDLLDTIFDAERELYNLYRGLPFDVRVMTPHSTWSDKDLFRNAYPHYVRPSDTRNE